MKKAALIFGIALLAVIAWQIGACYVANSELQSDMKDLAVQNPARSGLASFDTEEELRNEVIVHAKERGIQLAPEQVTVARMLTPGMLDISIAADYTVPLKLLGLSFPIHFNPSTSHRGEIVVK